MQKDEYFFCFIFGGGRTDIHRIKEAEESGFGKARNKSCSGTLRSRNQCTVSLGHCPMWINGDS